MKIWIDGDSIGYYLIHWIEANYEDWQVVADEEHRLEKYIKNAIYLPVGEEAVDNYILKHLKPEDIVITRDFRFALEVIQSMGRALNDKGFLFTEDFLTKRIEEQQIAEALRKGGHQPYKKNRGFNTKEFEKFKIEFSKITRREM